MGVPDRPGPAAPRLLAELRRRAAERCPRIVFPETEDPRVLEAAAAVHREGIGRPILLGGRTFELAAKDLGAVENILIPGDPRREEIAGLILEKRRHRGMTEEEALERAGEPLLFGAGLVALGARLVGEAAERSPTHTCVVFDGVPGEALVQALDLEGIAVSSGAACASGSLEPSPVLVAMGDPHPEGALRVSLGPGSTAGEIERLLAVLPRILEGVRLALELQGG